LKTVHHSGLQADNSGLNPGQNICCMGWLKTGARGWTTAVCRCLEIMPIGGTAKGRMN
jgi:hypothetical protein